MVRVGSVFSVVPASGVSTGIVCGSSSLGMATTGCGWSYDDVLPLFKRLENFEGGDPAYRGRSGPIRVKVNEMGGPLGEALLSAGEEIGLERNSDYNAAAQDGMVLTQASIGNGLRMSTAIRGPRRR